MDINYNWIGWMKEGTHDKIWGTFTINKTYYTFWGRRGKRLNFKKLGDNWMAEGEARKLINSKDRKGYERVWGDMDAIWPDFRNELEQFLSYKMLAGGVR